MSKNTKTVLATYGIAFITIAFALVTLRGCAEVISFAFDETFLPPLLGDGGADIGEAK